ncbi:MAG TPA: glycine cleavage system aminomethyltransferase GcvT [Xanthomonadales bacterium]|nr:glycine cleavage system aminomethyltransferase GcvT [Xanthomonadales bacterium]
MRHTPLYQAHVDAGARLVDFAGWEMPINYGSQIDEHHGVRRDAGMFDVSHMCPVEVRGPQARAFLMKLLANDVGKLTEPGKALYSCMLNDNGRIIDDLICYFLAEDHFRVVVNAGTREKDLAWMKSAVEEFDAEVQQMEDYGMIAVQGPEARGRMLDLLAPELRQTAESLEAFFAAQCGDLFIARTGYTGEDGFEIIASAAGTRPLWNALLASGVKPCGLGARDSLRLEAGMSLYGQDMDEMVTPLESGLGWTVAMTDDRNFVGRPALEAQKEHGLAHRFTGVVLAGRGVLRHDQVIRTGQGEGVLTSGGFSPTLERAIGMARLPVGDDHECEVEIRGRWLPAHLMRPPFVRFGKPSAKMQALLDSESEG